MKYMLDINICIYAIKHKPPEVIKNFLKHNPDDICVSSITYGELMHGVEKSQAVERNRAAMILFLSSISILSFDSYAAEEYGKVRAELERKGCILRVSRALFTDKLITCHGDLDH